MKPFPSSGHTQNAARPDRVASVTISEMDDQVVAVIENKPLGSSYGLLSLDAARQAQAARPGQFAMVRILGTGGVLLRRPMSIYDVKPDAAPHSGPRLIQLLYKVVGRGTRLMAGLKPGDPVALLAPLGHGFFVEDYLEQAEQADEVLHVAGGIGIAALLMAARELAEKGFKQRLFFGGRSRGDLVGAVDFRPYLRQIVVVTEDGSCGCRGYVTGPLEDHLARYPDRRFLLLACGPWAMLQATAELAGRYGHRLLVSMENRMGCGLGVCLGCCIRVEGEGHGAYQRVCTEGPVFWADKVVWERGTLPIT